MTQHPFARVAAAVVGVVLSAGAVGAQTAGTALDNPKEPLQLRSDVVYAGGASIVRRMVDPPSSDFTTYIEGELVRVSIPSNWHESPGSNAVTFVPEGASTSAGAKLQFTQGLGMGLARNDKRDLRMTTDDFIESYILVNPKPGRTFRYTPVTIGDRPGLHTVLSSVSNETGEPERIEMFTTLLRDGTLFYVLGVAPRDSEADYTDTFRRVVGSIQIMDCDPCVP